MPNLVKCICIGVGGIIFDEENKPSLRVKMIGGDDEREVLQAFKKIVEKHKAGSNLMLCAHNGKEFDFAYLCAAECWSMESVCREFCKYQAKSLGK